MISHYKSVRLKNVEFNCSISVVGVSFQHLILITDIPNIPQNTVFTVHIQNVDKTKRRHIKTSTTTERRKVHFG
jgi:hypothetical protein